MPTKNYHPAANGGRGDGLTLREHFAGLAMQGLAANANTGALHGANLIATRAVELADALLEALHPPK